MALANCVRLRISRSRTPTSIKAACCSAVFTGTKRIVGRLVASQSASASAASFLPRLTYGLRIGGQDGGDLWSAATALQRNGVLVFHIAWRMTASSRATATRAFLKPTCLLYTSPSPRD